MMDNYIQDYILMIYLTFKLPCTTSVISCLIGLVVTLFVAVQTQIPASLVCTRDIVIVLVTRSLVFVLVTRLDLLLFPGDCWSRDTSRDTRDLYLLILNRSNSAWSSDNLCWYCIQKKYVYPKGLDITRLTTISKVLEFVTHCITYDSLVKVIICPLIFELLDAERHFDLNTVATQLTREKGCNEMSIECACASVCSVVGLVCDSVLCKKS